MAKPNYSFEKRQRELAKKRKKEDKLRDKADRKVGGDTPSDDTTAAGDSEPGLAQSPAGPATPA